jgi:hypothetical protein
MFVAMPENGFTPLFGSQTEIGKVDAHLFLRLYCAPMIEANLSPSR